jgi:hypothetical protein
VNGVFSRKRRFSGDHFITAYKRWFWPLSIKNYHHLSIISFLGSSCLHFQSEDVMNLTGGWSFMCVCFVSIVLLCNSTPSLLIGCSGLNSNKITV